MKKDIQILRTLSNQYFEIASSDTNKKNMLLHKQVNDLKQPRPLVLIEEIPWHEMNMNDELTIRCEDPIMQGLEGHFRRTLFKWHHLRGDMIVTPYFPVYKQIHSTGIGLDRIVQDEKGHESIQSHVFVDQLATEDDLEKLHNETISYDKTSTLQAFGQVASIFGDILPVKIVGTEPGGYGLGCRTWDDIVNYRVLDSLFYDLIDRPEFMHKLVGKMTDIYLDKIKQYESLGLLDGDSYYNHCTAALTDDLHPDQSHVKLKDVWGRGLAQIFASVSPEMHDEFDTQYMLKALEPYGLVYYGCCEPLDNKIHILEQIKNLRKISITPWANVDTAAELIGTRYVLASKPNPSHLAVSHLNHDDVKKELTRIVNACKRNGCSANIVLKDITTVCHRPENLIEWEKIAMSIVNHA